MNVFCRITFVFLALFIGMTFLLGQTEHGSTKNSSDSLDHKAILELTRKFYLKVDRATFYPTVSKDSMESFYVSLDTFEIQILAERLSKTNLVTTNFVTDYIKIYFDVHEKLKSGEIVWRVGELPPFGNGSNPWCNCQDVPYDEPSPWQEIELETIQLSDSSGQFYWKWANVDSDWGEHRYYFEVEKVSGQWKISHLEGFTPSAFFGNK